MDKTFLDIENHENEAAWCESIGTSMEAGSPLSAVCEGHFTVT